MKSVKEPCKSRELSTWFNNTRLTILDKKFFRKITVVCKYTLKLFCVFFIKWCKVYRVLFVSTGKKIHRFFHLHFSNMLSNRLPYLYSTTTSKKVVSNSTRSLWGRSGYVKSFSTANKGKVVDSFDEAVSDIKDGSKL